MSLDLYPYRRCNVQIEWNNLAIAWYNLAI